MQEAGQDLQAMCHHLWKVLRDSGRIVHLHNLHSLYSLFSLVRKSEHKCPISRCHTGPRGPDLTLTRPCLLVSPTVSSCTILWTPNEPRDAGSFYCTCPCFFYCTCPCFFFCTREPSSAGPTRRQTQRPSQASSSGKAPCKQGPCHIYQTEGHGYHQGYNPCHRASKLPC